MKAIHVRYRGPTGSSGSRLIASESDGKRVSVPYDHALDDYGNYERAAYDLAKRMGWSGRLIGGSYKGDYFFVFAGGESGRDRARRSSRSGRDPGKRPAYAWQIWSEDLGEAPSHVQSYADKGQAQAFIKRLKRSHPHVRYVLRHAPVPTHRLFEAGRRVRRAKAHHRRKLSRLRA